MRLQAYLIYLILSAAVLTAQHLYAQPFPSLQFSHLTSKEGLSSNYATGIAEDKQGFIWIGTGNGLNRYDGYRIKHYFHSNSDSNSLISNAIQKISCDSKGRLWISTEDGLSCYDPANNHFTNFTTQFSAPHHISNNSSVNVYEDENKNIWICNQLESIYKVNEKLEAIAVAINIPAFDFFQKKILGYDQIFRDKKGNEWGYSTNHIYALDKKTKQPLTTFDFSASLQTSILKMAEGSNGRNLVSTWGAGLQEFDPEKKSLQRLSTLPFKIFPDINEWLYRSNKWMITVEGNQGLYLVDEKHNSAKNYAYIPGDPSSIQGNNYFQCFVDSKNNLWISSSSGVNMIMAGQQTFDVIPVTDPGSTNYSLYKNGTVFSYHEQDSSIWLAKRYVSTFEYDSDFQLKNFYASLAPLSSTKRSSNGSAYYFIKKGKELFISTDSGLIVYNTVTKQSSIHFPEQVPGAISFRTMLPLSDSTLLVRSFDFGLFVFNSNKKKFTRHYNKSICAGCTALKLSYIFKSSKNEIFISTQGQAINLYKFTPATNQFIPILATNDKSFGMQSSSLFGMDEDKEGNLWITSSSGLFVYNPVSNLILKQAAANGQTGSLFRICFDNNGNAWTNGVSGIWCYVKASGKWISFNGEDGLPGSQFEAIIAKRPNGDIVAGLEGAIAIFHPAQLFTKENEPPAIITEANVDDSSFSFPLNKQSAKNLILQAGHNSFAVDFALLNYINPVASRYYYKLTPLMKDFQLNDNGHINFNGLAPGTYTLHVKGGNKAGFIFSDEDVLTIEVLPHWYQSTWFKIICLLLFATLLFSFVKWRIRSAKKEAELKQKIAEIEMQALRAQMNPHFIFNSLNSIENFMMQNEKRLASDYLNKFSRLIRSILDSSRNEWVPVAKDMEALQLYVDLQLLRLNNKFSYHTNIEPLLLEGDFKVPSLLIQPFVENAIEHGLAHSDKNNLSLTVTAKVENDFIIYQVEDNGIGRQQAAAYNLQNKPKHISVGLGITNDRLNILNKGLPDDTNLMITDLYDDAHQPAGTRVSVKIKIQ